MSGRVPDFFIVGQPKCGTTALYEILRRHPQLFLPAEKEPHFFTTDRPYAGAPRVLRRYLELFRGFEDREKYLRLFADAGPGQLVGEASASYLWSREAAASIARERPDAKIVAILREPSALLRSLHLQMVETRVEKEGDLLRALAADEPEPDVELPPDPQRYYHDHVRYADQLRRYFDRLPRSQVLVLLYDDFRADNPATVRRVLRFLGVDEDVELGGSSANPSVQVRSPRADRALHSVAAGDGRLAAGAKTAIKAVTPQRLRRRSLEAVRHRLIHAAPAAPDERTTAELHRRFRLEVDALGDLLGQELGRSWEPVAD